MTGFWIWFGMGFIGSIGIYLFMNYTETDSEWCPSPAGLMFFLLGIVLGPVSLICFIGLLIGLLTDFIGNNKKFMEWLTTPICKKKKK